MKIIAWLKKWIWPEIKVKRSSIEGILDVLDADDDGYISGDELIAWVKTLGVRL